MPAAGNKMPRATKVLVGTSFFINQKIKRFKLVNPGSQPEL